MPAAKKSYQPFTIHVADTLHPGRHENHLSLVDGPYQVSGPSRRPRAPRRMSAATSGKNRQINQKMINRALINQPDPLFGYPPPNGFFDNIPLPIPLNAPYTDPSGILNIVRPPAAQDNAEFFDPDANFVASRSSFTRNIEAPENIGNVSLYNPYNDPALQFPNVEDSGAVDGGIVRYIDPQDAQYRPLSAVVEIKPRKKRELEEDEAVYTVKQRKVPVVRPKRAARPARPKVYATQPVSGPARGDYVPIPAKVLGKRVRNGLHGQNKRARPSARETVEVVIEAPRRRPRAVRPKIVATQQPGPILLPRTRGVIRTRNQKDEGIVITKRAKIVKARKKKIVAPSDRVTRQTARRRRAAQVFDAVEIPVIKKKIAKTARQQTAARSAEENARIRAELLAYQNGPIRRGL